MATITKELKNNSDLKSNDEYKYYYIYGELIYEGGFLKDMYNGKGKYYSNGKIIYEGNFLNDEYSGEGKLYDTTYNR